MMTHLEIMIAFLNN